MESVSVGGTDDFSLGIGKQADKAIAISETRNGVANLKGMYGLFVNFGYLISNKVSHHKISFIN